MDCIYYNKEQLLRNTKIPLSILKTADDVFAQCARDMIDVIKNNNSKGESSVIIIPIGPTGQYPLFVEYVNKNKLDLENTYFILMDAYIEDGKTLPYEHRLSLRRRFDELLFNKIDENLKIKNQNIIGINPEEISAVGRKIQELGKIDLCVAGIGINGHIGMNEQKDLSAEKYLEQAGTRILELSLETRLISAINNFKGAVCEIPQKGVTLGLKEMMCAEKLTAYCFRDWHNSVVKRACCEEPSGNFPATIMQLHKNAKIYTHEAIVCEI